MKLQYRILLAQLPALVVLVVVLLFGGATLSRLGEQGPRVLDENYRSVLAAQRMKEGIERLDSAAWFRIAGRVETADGLVERHRPVFERELAVEEANITEPGEEELATELRAAWTDYDAAYRVFLATPADRQEAFYFEQLLPSFQRVNLGTERVLGINQDAMVRKADEAAAGAEVARTTFLLLSAAGLLGAISLGAYVSHRLTAPLRLLSQTAVRIGDGDLDVRLHHTSVAELDALADALNVMGEKLRRYRRAADSELVRAREAAQAAIESLADAVLVLTVRGEVRASNGAARRLLGIDSRTRRLDACDPGVVAAVEEARRMVAEGARPAPAADFSGVVIVETSDGERALLPHATPVNDAVTGELVGVTVLLQDVTRLRRLDELKGSLVQTVAHELRTPLTSLGMALHLCLDERVGGTLAPKAVELLESAREDVARLRALVEDLLDLSRIQRGKLSLHHESVAPADLLREAAESLRSTAESGGVVLTVDAPKDLPTMEGDRARLHLALSNLVANAIRHSSQGGEVCLRAMMVPGGLRVEVEDHGPGVPAALRTQIFDAFVRGMDQPPGGVGLGLYIVREVVEAHGGTVGVGETDGGGARFWFQIPSPSLPPGAPSP